jgi:hypothetical protein
MAIGSGRVAAGTPAANTARRNVANAGSIRRRSHPQRPVPGIAVPPGLPGIRPTAGQPAAVPLGPIPNAPGFVGYQVFGQSAVRVPGIDAAGIVVSNGLCIRAGL